MQDSPAVVFRPASVVANDFVPPAAGGPDDTASSSPGVPRATSADFQANLPINRVRGDLLAVKITAALALACCLAANKLVRMIWGRLKDFLTITTTVIFHQAARQENRRDVSLEAPLNATPQQAPLNPFVYETADTGCSFFLATGRNNVRPLLDAVDRE